MAQQDGDAAAEVYGLEHLVRNIEDRPDNATRFLVIGRELLAASGDDKTTVPGFRASISRQGWVPPIAAASASFISFSTRCPAGAAGS